MFCNQNEFAVEKEVTILLRSELVAALISSHFLIFQKKIVLSVDWLYHTTFCQVVVIFAEALGHPR